MDVTPFVKPVALVPCTISDCNTTITQFYHYSFRKMTYAVPHKRILSKEQLEAFQVSKTYQEIIEFIETLNSAVLGVKLADPCSESKVIPKSTVFG